MIEQKDIPKHWEIKKLGEVCERVDKVIRKEKKTHEEFLYLDIGGIDNQTNKIQSYKNYKWKEAPSRAQQIICQGDILFSTVRTYMKNIAMVEKKIFEGQIASSGFTVIRGNKKMVHPKFIFYFTLSQKFLQPLNDLQTGSSYPAVRDKDVFTQPLPVPPLPEQQLIVSKIEELLSELENGKQQLETAQRQLKVYRQSLLKWAFEGKLTNKVVEGELPEGWKWIELNEILESVKNGWGSKPDDAGEKKILRISSVRPNSVDLNDVRFLKNDLSIEYEISENDLLFTRYNGTKEFVGVCARVPNLKEKVFYPDKLIRCRPKIKEHFHSMYLQYASNCGRTRSFVVAKLKTTAGQTGISGSEIKQIPIPLATLKEQQCIVDILESKLTICVKIEETITKSLQQAEMLKQSILKKAFEGKLLG